MKYEAAALTRRAAIRLTGAAALAIPAATSTIAVAQSRGQNPTSSTGGFSVKWFGAKGDSDVTGSAGSDDTAAIQAAINYIQALGGGTIYFPEGYYKLTTYLTLCQNIRVVGAGRKGSVLVQTAAGGGGASLGESIRNGSVFFSNWPSNSTTQANIQVEHLGITSAAASSLGAGFYDNGGAYINIRDCVFNGTKYGVVFDQTECSDVTECDFEAVTTGGACVYLVNGPTLTPGNLVVVTNRISISKCQLNPTGASNYCILDEGGYTHSYVDNNYNGGLNHIYIAGAQAYQIIGGEFEESSRANIVLDYRKLDGTGVGGCLGLISGAMLINSTHPCIQINSTSGPNALIGNWFSRSDGNPPICGANNATELNLIGNFTNSPTLELVDGCNATNLNDSRIEMPVRSNSLTRVSLTTSYYNRLVRSTNAAGCAYTIQADATNTTTVMPIGATFLLEQSATGRISIAAGPGVIIVGPTATTQQYQRLKARKIASNTWQTELIVQNPLTPAFVASSGALTSSGGGIGYATGAGGTATQIASKSASVTLNKLSGQITMSPETLESGAITSFALTNNQIDPGDVLILNHMAGGTFGAYTLNGRSARGSAIIDVRNNSRTALAEGIVIAFAILKAVTA
jgi:hypothetical protein